MATIYIGKVIVDPSIVTKLNTKHQATEAEVHETFEWPARVDVALEDHPEHGRRWVAFGTSATGRRMASWLLPAPEYEGDRADTWVVKTARWL